MALPAGAAETVPRPPLLPTVSFPRRVHLACRLPQRRDRVPSGAGCRSTEHGESRPRRRWGEEGGRACLGLDRRATLAEPHGGSVSQRFLAQPRGWSDGVMKSNQER